MLCGNLKTRNSTISLVIAVIALIGIVFFTKAEIDRDSKAQTLTLDPIWAIKMDANIESISFSSYGKHLLIGTGLSKKGVDNKIYFFEPLQGNTPVWIYQCDGSVREVSVSTDGNYIVAGTDIGYVYLFEKSGDLLWVYRAPEMISAISISGDGNYIVAGTGNWNGNGGKVYFFHRASNVPLWVYQTKPFGGAPWIEDVSVSLNGSYIAVGAHDGVHILKKMGESLLYYDTQSWVLSLSMSSSGRYVVAGTFGGTVYFFDMINESVVWSYHSEGAIWSTDMSSTGDSIVVGDIGAYSVINSTIIFFRNEEGAPLWKYQTTTVQGPIYVSISLDGSYIAVGTADHTIYYLHSSSNNPIWTYKAHGEINSIDVSPYGKYVAAGTKGSLNQYLYLFYMPDGVFSLYEISISNDSFGFAVGTDGVIIESVNGHWYFIDSPTSNTLNGIYLTNETYGFAVGLNGTILLFNGMLWEAYNSPTMKHLFDIAMIDGAFGFSVGDGLYKYDGESWNVVEEAISGCAIELYSHDFGVIIDGPWSYIYNGTDWQRLMVDPVLGFEVDLYDVSVINNSVAFATGLDICIGGVVYKFQNNKWSVMDYIEGGLPTSISMLNETMGLIVGYDMNGKGVIWKYEHTSWNRQEIPDIGPLRKVQMLGQDRAFALGDNGTILRFDGFSWIIEDILEDHISPLVNMPYQEPTTVLPNTTVIVYVNVTDAESGVREVILSYKTDESFTWINVTMARITGNTYLGGIPGFLNGTHVKYKIIAYDRAENVAINDNEGRHFIYIVIPEFPSWQFPFWLGLLLTLFVLALFLIYVLNIRRERSSGQSPSVKSAETGSTP